ncbi:MAG: hypothetical protein PSY14_01845 [bacterium]|nr:hypothetical protein [bacterium]
MNCDETLKKSLNAIPACKNNTCVIEPAQKSASQELDEESSSRAECEKNNGRWEGTVKGKGRLTGCNMPTKDGGKIACWPLFFWLPLPALSAIQLNGG